MKLSAIIRTVVALSLGALAPCLGFAESTIAQPLTRFQYNPNGEYYYFQGVAKWGAPSCPTATYVMFSPALPNYKQLYSIVYAAKLSGSSVQFSGSCHTDPDYFVVNYVYVN